MTTFEDHLRVELHAIVDTEQAPDVWPGLRQAARRRHRGRVAAAMTATAAAVVATVLVALSIGQGSSSAPTVEKPTETPQPPVSSYFPSKTPPLPVRVTVRPRPPASAGMLARDAVIAAWRAWWADSRYRYAKGTPTDTAPELRHADLVVVSTPGYRRPEALGTVRNRLAWMLVSTGYTYQYQPYLHGCSVKAWWQAHRALCASPPPIQTHTGARFDFIDALTGAGLIAIATDDHDRRFATTVQAYVKVLPPPPGGARTLDGGDPILQSNTLIGPAPAGVKPRLSRAEALAAFRNYGAYEAQDKLSASLMTLYVLAPPAGDPDYQNATWHAHLVWLVRVDGVSQPAGIGAGPRPATMPPMTHCTGAFPVDATTGKAYFYETSCPTRPGGGVGPIQHR